MSDLAGLLRKSSRILVFTGAGVSTSSGIPDFRGPQGVWKKRQPVYYQDFMAKESARVEHWDYKLEGWEGFRDAVPNAAHKAVVRLERLGKVEAVVTQNIDGLHQKAGSDPAKVIELHGTNAWIECLKCRRRSEPGPHFEAFRKTRKAPVCACGGFLKSATISFGQPMPQTPLATAFQAAQDCDLVLSLGSTLEVLPAAEVPASAARMGKPYVVVNQGPTGHDRLATLRLEGDVAVLLPEAVSEL